MSMKALQESTDSVDREACSVTPLVTEKLWVEKYAPNSFTELLSDEHTNREVNTIPNCTLLLQRSQPFCWCLISFTWHVYMCLVQVLLWLKQWDSCVFGSHIRATCDDVLSALRRHSSTIQKNANNKNFFSKTKGGPVDMPLNAPSSNPEGLGGSFSKRSPVDSTPEQKVGLELLCCDQKLSIKDCAALSCCFPTVTEYLPDVAGVATLWSTWSWKNNTCSCCSQTLWLPCCWGLCYDHTILAVCLLFNVMIHN